MCVPGLSLNALHSDELQASVCGKCGSDKSCAGDLAESAISAESSLRATIIEVKPIGEPVTPSAVQLVSRTHHRLEND